jgi:hypothetical protein
MNVKYDDTELGIEADKKFKLSRLMLLERQEFFIT